MKRILITGSNSYIGNAVRDYLLEYKDDYDVKMQGTIGWIPSVKEFIGYDVVFNVAGIAHRKETSDNKQLFFDVNRDLSVNIAKNAKMAGVRQYILLSTMSVYGLSAGHITKTTPTRPVTAYGKSKAEADAEIKEIEDNHFLFTCLRPPMVYGKNCKGNYQSLRSFVLKMPFFPNYDNKRSMIYIGNLCEFVKNCIDNEKSGLFFPQNAEYVCTSNMAKLIAEKNHKKMRLINFFNPVIKICPLRAIKKVFGSLTYEAVDLVGKYGFEESIILTETEGK